jgi:hypothetical protein
MEYWTARQQNLLSDWPVRHLAAGSQLGPYRIEGILGGVGEVYEAPRHTPEPRRRDSKFPPNASVAALSEKRAVAALNDPNICTLALTHCAWLDRIKDETSDRLRLGV